MALGNNLSQPVTDFSQHACRKRYEALVAGTAKPTPESIQNPDEDVLARRKSRIDKEQKIQADKELGKGTDSNIEGNSWTSRMRTYY